MSSILASATFTLRMKFHPFFSRLLSFSKLLWSMPPPPPSGGGGCEDGGSLRYWMHNHCQTTAGKPRITRGVGQF